MKPHRVQLCRTKGWRMPPHTMSVARPTIWGNWFKIGEVVRRDHYMSLGAAIVAGIDPDAPLSRGDAVKMFRLWITSNPWEVYRAKKELAGKNLACWCGLDVECHADIWLEIANR